MCDNAPAKVVTVWLWHYDEPALHIMQVNANSKKIICASWPPQFLSVPVSTIDYDNVFEIAVFHFKFGYFPASSSHKKKVQFKKSVFELSLGSISCYLSNLSYGPPGKSTLYGLMGIVIAAERSVAAY